VHAIIEVHVGIQRDLCRGAIRTSPAAQCGNFGSYEEVGEGAPWV